MVRKARSSLAPRRRPSANVIVTASIVVIAALVIGGVLLSNRSEGAEGGLPQELVAGQDGNALIETTGSQVTVVEYLDYQCPACASYYQNVTRKIETDYAGKINFVTRNFPLDPHPLAQPAARAAEAAAKQGRYREMYHALYDNYQQWALTKDGQRLSDDTQRATTLFDRYATDIGLDLDRFHTDLAAPELQERIDADIAAGEEADVSSTPTIFVDGERFEPTSDEFTEIDRQLRRVIDETLG